MANLESCVLSVFPLGGYGTHGVCYERGLVTSIRYANMTQGAEMSSAWCRRTKIRHGQIQGRDNYRVVKKRRISWKGKKWWNPAGASGDLAYEQCSSELGW